MSALPKNWIKIPLGEVGRWFGGGTPSKANPQFWTGGNIPWVSPKDMKVDLISDAQDHITKDAVSQSSTNLVEPGSVLIVVRSGILQHTLPIAVTQRQVALNQDLKAVKPLDNVRSDYLALALKAFERDILHTCTKTGTTVQSLELPVFLRFEIPIAPVEEQRRIVSEIEKQFTRLEAGVSALKRVQSNLKRYRAAVLKAACEGKLVPTEAELAKTEKRKAKLETGEELLARILNERRKNWSGRGKYKEPAAPDTADLPPLPEGWTWASGEQLFSWSSGEGLTQKTIQEGQYPVYGGNGVTGYHNAFVAEIPTLVIGRVGALCGNVYLTDGPAWITDNAIYAIQTPSCVEMRFIRLTFTRAELNKRAAGSGQPFVNQRMLNETVVPLPPLAEQMRIVAEVERRLSVVEELEAVVSTNLQRATRLRQSILQKAFTGNLVLQDSSEEPDNRLLGKIRSRQDRKSEVRLTARKSEPTRKDQGELVMKAVQDPNSALKMALSNGPEESTAKGLFTTGLFDREQVYAFYDAIADSPKAVKRLSTGHHATRIKKHPQRVPPKHLPPLRLHELWIKKFKNLENYSLSFDPRHALDVLLGWNGTGKSNLFEVLIVIFRDIHKWKTKNKWTPQDGLEGYRIRYEIAGKLVEIEWGIDSRRPDVKLAEYPYRKPSEPDFKKCKREAIPLPHFVFGYYSGPSNRFAELFSGAKQDHYGRLLKQTSADEETLANLLKERRFFNAETHHAKYALLSFFHHDDLGIHRFLKKHLRIDDLESVLFVLKRPRWARNNNPEDFWGAAGLLRPVLEHLRRHSIANMVLPQRVDDGFQETTRDHYFMLLPSKKHLQALASEYADPTSFFVALESTDFSSIIHEVRIRVRICATATKKAIVTFKEMSEGEQQLLMVLGLLRFTKMSQSLVLLDEPDTHLNPHWQLGYLHLLLEALEGDMSDQEAECRLPIEELEKRLTSQVLLSTHDPLAIAGLLKENIHLLKRHDKTEECFAVPPAENPRGMGFTGILTSEIFGLKSDLDAETLCLLDQHAGLVGKKTLTIGEKKRLREMTDEVERLGFKSTSSDPYYRAFLQALARRRNTRDLLRKATWTKADIESLGKETDEILEEIEREDNKK